jgi:hypothetical protein
MLTDDPLSPAAAPMYFRRVPIIEPSVADAIALQARSCAALGSPLYAELLTGLLADFESGGVVYDVLAQRQRPVRDAVSLRLLGALHRRVLEGEEPALGRHYPSVGGSPRASLVDDALEVIARCRLDVDGALTRQVQTNEVGRAATLAGGFAEIARATRLPLSLREIGSSAGLNLHWDGYYYDTGESTLGDSTSLVRFGPHMWTNPPKLAPVEIRDRAGTDIAPLDPADPQARLTLLSFVWPDMAIRFDRLRAALDHAADRPPIVARADAADWLAEALPACAEDATTVVFHSIVWQYLPPATQARVRNLLHEHGATATSASPLAWLRMEPAGPVTALTLTMWPDGTERVLATAGYHGADINWQAT